MVIRNPAHAQAFAYPSIQYAHAQPGLVGPTQVPTAVAAQPHLAPPQSTLAATFINPTIDGTAVLPSSEPTALPAGTLLLQPAVDYPQQLHHHSQQYYPHQLTSPYDILQSLQKPNPTSLLDSYVPSSVIWAAQRQRNTAALLNHRQILHPIHGNFIAPTIAAHPAHQFYQHHGSHQPGYNTIAYSTVQGYSKRSPKLVAERPLKLKKRT